MTTSSINQAELDLNKPNIEKSKKLSEWQKFANEGYDFLKKGDYLLASEKFNNALKYDIKNSNLQALNGIAYHLNAKYQDANNYQLAKQGYELASKFDPSNWAPFYLNGLINFKEKEYNKAKNNFINAALRNWDNYEILFNIGVASYYDLDFETSAKVIKYLKKQNLDKNLLLKVNKTCSIIFSFTDDHNYRNECLQNYLKNENSLNKKNNLKKKIKFWNSLKKIKTSEVLKKADILLAQTTNETITETETDPFASDDDISNVDNFQEFQKECFIRNFKAGTDEFTKCIISLVDEATKKALEEEDITDERMVIVDVVIIGSTEDARTRTGINILDGLSFQFGDDVDGEDAYSKINTITRDGFDSTNNTQSKTVVRALTIPAIEYSLNIINSRDNDSKILAKPSLIALAGEESTFFSGVTINGAATSGTGDSVSIEEEIGVSLSVTPDFISDTKVYLSIAAERTFLIDPKKSVLYEYRLDTTKTNVAANVVLNIGETLILGGLTEQQDTETLDGVPGLSKVPLVKLFFSEDIKRNYKKSITILLTPRLAPVNKKSKAKEKKISSKNTNEIIFYNLLEEENIEFSIKKDFENFKNILRKNFIGGEDLNILKTDNELIEIAKNLKI